MELIDERGRLFGRVNVVDALVVLLGVAVVAAGVALVAGGGSGGGPAGSTADDPETTVATVALGDHPAYVAGLVEPGNVTVDGHDATITDVYRTPAGEHGVHLFARVSVQGNRTDQGFVVGEDGEPMVVRHGRTVAVETAAYQLGGLIATVGDDRTFETDQRRVVLNVSTTRAIGDAISSGDSQRIAGTQVAAVEDVQRTGSEDGNVSLRVTVSVEALAVDGRTEYAGGPLRIGREIPLVTDRYAVEGTIVEVES